MLSLASRVHAISDQVSSDLDGETIIMSIASGEYFGLEGSGTDIWMAVQQPTTVRAICNSIVEAYAVSVEQCEADVMGCLSELFKCGLITIIDEDSAQAT